MSILREYKRPSVIYFDNYETGDLSRANAGAIGGNATTTNPHAGKYSYDSLGGGSIAYYDLGTGFSTFYFRQYIYISNSQAPNDYNIFMTIWSAGYGNQSELAVNTFGGGDNLDVHVDGGASAYSYPYTLLPNQWYCVELERIVGTPGRVSLWVNEVLIGSETPTITGDSQIFRTGCASNAMGEFWVDDVVVAQQHIGLYTHNIPRTLTRNLRSNRLHSGTVQYIRRRS